MGQQINENPDRKRFEYHIDGQIAFVEYIINSKGVIYLTHTEVPKNIEGRGIAFRMIGQVLENIERRQLKLFPLCPVVVEYIRRHPGWKRVLAENV